MVYSPNTVWYGTNYSMTMLNYTQAAFVLDDNNVTANLAPRLHLCP